MYKNEQEWLEAVHNDDLTATVEMLQKAPLPDVSPSPRLPHIRRQLLTGRSRPNHWLPRFGHSVGTMVSIVLLLLLVGLFWINQASQTASGPVEPNNAMSPVLEPEVENVETAVASTTPENSTEMLETAVPTATTLPLTDQVWWLAIRRQLTDVSTNLTEYEIEVGYKLETVDTATAQLFLVPQNWQTAADLYPFSDPVTIFADEDSITFTLSKDLEQFFQEIPPRANSLLIALSTPGTETDFLVIEAWKNFVDTEYFAGPIFITPASDSSLNVFSWEFDNNFFTVESPPRRFGGTEKVSFVVNYHYQLTQASNAYVKLILVDQSNGSRPLDSAFVRAKAGTGLVTVYLEFDPGMVNGRTSLAIESFIIREDLSSPDQTASGWIYEPSE